MNLLLVMLGLSLLLVGCSGRYDGVIVYYSFNDGTLRDSAGNVDGIDHNTIDEEGKIGRGRGFYAEGSGVQINEIKEMHFKGTDSFSFNLWFKKNSQDKEEDLLLSYRPTEVFPLIGMVLHERNPRSFIRDSNGVYGDSGDTDLGVNYCDGKWHMYTFVHDGSVTHTYIDGVLKKTVYHPDMKGTIIYGLERDGVPNYKYPYFMLGNEYDKNAGGTLNGSIDEFSMWNKALDYDTIQWLYNDGEGRKW